MSYRYGPGPLLAIVEPGGVALVDAEMSAEVRLAVAAALRSGGGFGGFVDALTAHFGASLSALPDFALALVEHEGTRVAVRGRLTAHADAPISGAGVTTWTEAVVPTGTTVSLGDPAAALAADALAVSSGMVFAGGIAVNGGGSSATAASVAAPAAKPVAAGEQPDSAPPPAPEGARPVSTDDSEEPSGATTLGPMEDTSLQGEADDGDLAEDTSFGGLWGSTVASAGGTAASSRQKPGTAPASPAGPSSAGVPKPDPRPKQAPEPETAAEPEAQPETEPESSAQQPVEAPQPPASSPTPVVNGMIAGLPDFLGGTGTGTGTVAPAAPAAPAAPETTETPDPTSSETAPPETAPPGTELDEGLGDHDGATLAVSRIAELAPDALGTGAPAAASAPPAPLTVGRAMLSTGQEVVIDRSVIIGRRPQASRVTGDVPHLFAVPSPQQDISRNHLEIRPEGSSVVVVDLQTTNGSMLRRGAADPVRLHPGEPTVVVNGDVIDLGDGVTVTFVELP